METAGTRFSDIALGRLFCLSFLLACFSAPALAAENKDEALIPAGGFLMGTLDGGDSERPVHLVELDAFYIDRVEVSNLKYQAFAPAFRRSTASFCDLCPATRVNWQEASDYCQSLGKRLPSEAEWERAARGPHGWDYSFGERADPKLAHFNVEMDRGPAPVNSMTPNGFGLHHMSGNVWEWVSDWFDPGYYQAAPRKNPEGPGTGFRKSVRGGSWYNAAYYVHAGMRFSLATEVRLGSVGFRCARSAGKEARP